MDFDLSEDQQEILGAVVKLLEQYAGPERAIALNDKGEYDQALETALDDGGFLDVGLGDETGWLEAVLIVEAVADTQPRYYETMPGGEAENRRVEIFLE